MADAALVDGAIVVAFVVASFAVRLNNSLAVPDQDGGAARGDLALLAALEHRIFARSPAV